MRRAGASIVPTSSSIKGSNPFILWILLFVIQPCSAQRCIFSLQLMSSAVEIHSTWQQHPCFLAAGDFCAGHGAPSGASTAYAEIQPMFKLEWKMLLSAHDLSSSGLTPGKSQILGSRTSHSSQATLPAGVMQSCTTSRPANGKENKRCGESNNSFFPLERHKDCASSHEGCFQLGSYFSFQL